MEVSVHLYAPGKENRKKLNTTVQNGRLIDGGEVVGLTLPVVSFSPRNGVENSA
jgi:hypothetical protein